MKPLFKLLSLAAFFSIGIISCQKEFTIEEVPDPVDPPVANDSIYINKIFQIDSIAGVNDSSGLVTFVYDAQKRVVSITDSIKEPGGWFLFYSEKFHYSGSDTIPFKNTVYSYENALAFSDPAALDSTITYYQFNATGRNLYDSVIDVEITNDLPPYEYSTTITIKKYQYNGNEIYGDIVVKEDNGTLIRHGRDTSTIDANGNVIASREYGVNGSTTSLEINHSFTYDTKRSPFYGLSFFRSLDVLPFDEAYQLLQVKNNRTKRISSDGPGVPYAEVTSVYTYNSNNFPATIRETYTDYPGYVFKSTYTYKAL